GPASTPPRRDAATAAPAGRRGPTRSGSSTPPIRWPWPAVSRPVGCGPSTRPRGRAWGPKFSPQRYWNSVPAAATQGFLRRQFAHWGRPEALRVDNGSPWGSRGDLPTDLVLWLAGLAVAVRANPPRRPQDNGVVERSQGTGKRWAE